MNSTISSGFLSNIDGSFQPSADNNFTNIKPIYTSYTGPACLYTAVRYGKRYVLKSLKPDFALTPAYHTALRKEFEIGIQLDHTHICQTIGWEDVEGVGQSIVLEYIDGDTLQTLLERRQLTTTLARSIFRQMADALDYMHSKQIVHRDIKPSNIMITHNGQQVKIIDFSLSDSDTFNMLKCPAGTTGYIAPEQLQRGATTSSAADVYSTGMVMKDMVAVTHDSGMLAASRVCTRLHPDERPQRLTDVQLPSVHYRRWLTLLHATALLALALCIGALASRCSSPQPASSTEQSSGDGNTVVSHL